MTYVVLLLTVTFGGFIATLSFAYLIVSGVVSYIALRMLANHDPRIADVIFIALTKTPLPLSWFEGRGIIYRA